MQCQFFPDRCVLGQIFFTVLRARIICLMKMHPGSGPGTSSRKCSMTPIYFTLQGIYCRKSTPLYNSQLRYSFYIFQDKNIIFNSSMKTAIYFAWSINAIKRSKWESWSISCYLCPARFQDAFSWGILFLLLIQCWILHPLEKASLGYCVPDQNIP